MNVRAKNGVCWIVSVILILTTFMSSTVVWAASTIPTDDVEVYCEMDPKLESLVESEAELSMEPDAESDYESLSGQNPDLIESGNMNSDLKEEQELDSEIETSLEVDNESEAIEDVASAYSSTPAPVTDLYVTIVESSNINDEKRTETIPRSALTWTSKSLWFNDGDVATNIVCTYDNKGTYLHHRNTVDIYVVQEGQGTSGCYYRVNGTQESIESSTIDVTSANPFRATHKYTIRKSKVDEPYTIFTVGHIGLVPSGTSGSTKRERRETNVYIYWDYEGRADAPSVDFVYDQKVGQMLLSGADSSMEYRLKSGTPSSWQPCTDQPMYLDCTATTPTAYLVRYADAGNGTPSQSKEIILPARRLGPGATYNTTTELLTSINSNMEIRFGSGAYTDVQGNSMSLSSIVDTIPSGSTLEVGVRYKATATQQAGYEKKITLYPRSERPTSVALDSVAIKLTGCSSSMQYKVDSGDWKSISGSTVSLQTYAEADRAVPVYVRMKPTSTMAASKSVEIAIPRLTQGPAGSVDYTNEVIVGLENGNYQYSTSGTTWTSLTISNRQWDISKLISTTAKTLYLRWAATSTSPISGATLFNIPARPTAPSSVSFNYSVTGQATLTGVTTAMQYKKSADTVWTDVRSNNGVVFEIPTASTTYYVRTKATTQSFASANKTITLSKAGAAPSCSYDSTNELIKSLTTKMEMRIGNGAFTPVTATTFSTTDLINTITSGSSIVIQVRTMATATAPASANKVITLYARSAAPSSLVYNYDTNTITGCSSSMQYMRDTDTAWKAISGSTLKLQSSVSTERDVKVYIRMKPTTTSSASNSVVFTIPRASAS